MNLVSVIIPVKNREAYVVRCLNSVIAQSIPSWEAIVVDDGSEDDTVNQVLQLSRQDDKIKLLRRPEGRPPGANACRNIGLEASTGDWVLFLDSDDRLLPNAIEVHRGAVERSNNKDASVTNAIYGTNYLLPFGKKFIFRRNSFFSDFIAKRIKVHINSVMWSRQAIPDQPFEESLLAGQDFVFHLQQFTRVGLDKVLFTPEYTCAIEIGNDSISRNSSLRRDLHYLRARNMLVRDPAIDRELKRMIILNGRYTYRKLVKSPTYSADPVVKTFEKNIDEYRVSRSVSSVMIGRATTFKKRVFRWADGLKKRYRKEGDDRKATDAVLRDISEKTPYIKLKVFLNIGTKDQRFSQLWGTGTEQFYLQHIEVDGYCQKNGIGRVDYLKIDTKGKDEVALYGAHKMLSAGAIRFVEVVAGTNPKNESYVSLRAFQEYLTSLGYYLFGLYGQTSEVGVSLPVLATVNAVFIYGGSFMRLEGDS